MDTNHPLFTTIDEYIAQFPPEIQDRLQQIRKLVHEIVPLAIERISYKMPTFETDGKVLVHFAAFKKHIGFYPTPSGTDQFAEELSQYKGERGQSSSLGPAAATGSDSPHGSLPRRGKSPGRRSQGPSQSGEEAEEEPLTRQQKKPLPSGFLIERDGRSNPPILEQSGNRTAFQDELRCSRQHGRYGEHLHMGRMQLRLRNRIRDDHLPDIGMLQLLQGIV